MSQIPIDESFHEEAEREVERDVEEYGARLIRQAKSFSKRRKHPLVMKKDVQSAREVLDMRPSSVARNLIQIPSAGLVGAFLHGFTSELLGDADPLKTIVYVAVGLLGSLGVFYSIFRW